MNIPRLFHTIKHLRFTQIFFQLKNKVVKQKYVPMAAPAHEKPALRAKPIARYKGVDGEMFTFINLHYKFSGWNFTGNGMLWAYNQNYFDWINQKEFPKEEACQWIDRFIAELPNNKIGLDPYPIALRGINWIKFFCFHPECATKEREDSLYSQYRLLESKLEYHLLGNHLLEDAFSLTIGGHYFCDERMKQKAMKLMLQELKEQILPDGAHYEQSPMYHCILLDRLLDVYNFTGIAELVPFAQRMLGHLESICYADGSWPFFGDAALGIAPKPEDIKDYARRLGITWKTLPLKECGYRKMQSERMEAFVDVGNVKATYQPGHSHADALNFELQIDGKPFLVDTGISTYNKNTRRQYERSTGAHNTVTSQGRNSSDVWGGFRVGKRCHVRCIKDVGHCIAAEHNGFSSVHRRQFSINDHQFIIADFCKAEDCVAHLHFAPATGDISIEDNIIRTSLADIKVTGEITSIVLTECEVSTEYNIRLKSKEALLSFQDECIVTVEAKSNIQKI
jgi:hypothetical protein